LDAQRVCGGKRLDQLCRNRLHRSRTPVFPSRSSQRGPLPQVGPGVRIRFPPAESHTNSFITPYFQAPICGITLRRKIAWSPSRLERLLGRRLRRCPVLHDLGPGRLPHMLVLDLGIGRRVTKASRSNGSTTWPPPNTNAPER
jgi:hypothetical protein